MNPLTWLLDLIYPPKCVVCHKLLESSREPVCQHCMDNLPEHDGADPHVRFADRCVATCFYEEPLRASIHRFKFGGCRQYAAVYGSRSGTSWPGNLTSSHGRRSAVNGAKRADMIRRSCSARQFRVRWTCRWRGRWSKERTILHNRR